MPRNRRRAISPLRIRYITVLFYIRQEENTWAFAGLDDKTAGVLCNAQMAHHKSRIAFDDGSETDNIESADEPSGEKLLVPSGDVESTGGRRAVTYDTAGFYLIGTGAVGPMILAYRGRARQTVSGAFQHCFYSRAKVIPWAVNRFMKKP